MSMRNHITKLVRDISDEFGRRSLPEQPQVCQVLKNKNQFSEKTMQWIAAKSSVFAEVTKNYWQRVGPAFSRPTTTSTTTTIYHRNETGIGNRRRNLHIRQYYHTSQDADHVTKNYWQRVGLAFSCPTTTSTTTTIYHRNEADIGNRRRNFHIRQYHHTSPDADHGDELFELCKSLKPIDWRITGVADVKNQGQTPSCASHACATLLEMLIFRKYGQKIEISVHDLWNGSNDDINIPTDIFKWVMKNGVVRESDVPWVGREEKWVRKERVEVYRMIREVELMDFRQTYDFALALYDGPFVVEFETGDSWFSHESGSYSGESDLGSESDEYHCVVVVALQFVDGVPYFVCQNSYGTEWGLGGFFYVPVQRRPPLFLTGYRVHLEEEMSVETN